MASAVTTIAHPDSSNRNPPSFIFLIECRLNARRPCSNHDTTSAMLQHSYFRLSESMPVCRGPCGSDIPVRQTVWQQGAYAASDRTRSPDHPIRPMTRFTVL